MTTRLFKNNQELLHSKLLSKWRRYIFRHILFLKGIKTWIIEYRYLSLLEGVIQVSINMAEHRLVKEIAISIISTRLEKSLDEIENLFGVILDTEPADVLATKAKQLASATTVEQCIDIFI